MKKANNNNVNPTRDLTPQVDIAILKGRENFQDWRSAMKNLLISRNYWVCIEGYPKDDRSSYAERRRKDSEARLLICQTVEPCIESHITLTKFAREAWSILKKAFEKKRVNRWINLQSLYSVKLQDFCDIQDYVNAFMSVALQLRAIGKPVDGRKLGTLLLKGLTGDYQPMITAIKESNVEISGDCVKSILMEALNNQAEDNSNSGVVPASNQRSQNLTPRQEENATELRCWRCGDGVHKNSNCPMLRNESEALPHTTVPAASPTHADSDGSLLKQRITTGEKLYELKRYKEALDIYNKVLQSNPEYLAVLVTRAESYMMLEKYHKAVVDARKCITLNPTLIKAYEIVIKCSRILGDAVEGVTVINQILKLDPYNKIVREEQTHIEELQKFSKEAELAYAQKDYRKVIDCMTRCLKVSPSCAAFEQQKAKCITFLDQETQQRERSAHLLERSADQYYNNKMYYDALTDYSKAIKLCPESAIHYDKRAACYMMLGEYLEALVDCRKCIAIDPTFIQAHARVMDCSLKMGALLEAKLAMNKVLELNPNYSNILDARKNYEHLEKFSKEAEVAYIEKNYRKALDCIDRCYEVSTSCPAINLRRAECLKFLEQEEEEKTQLAITKNGIANQHYNNQRFDKALAIYNEILELCPQSAKYYNNRAACYMKLREHAKAIDDARKCINLDPTSVKAYARVLECSLVVGNIREARLAMTKIVQLDPNNNSILTQREHLEYVEKFSREAEVAYTKKCYRKVIDCIDRCCEVSTLCPALEQRKAECLELLEQEEKRKAKSVDVKIAVAKEHYNAKRYIEACILYTEAIEYRNHPYLCLRYYGKVPTVTELCPESPGTYSNRAACYMMLGKFQEALVDARKCITIDPTIIKAHVRILKCSLIMGNVHEARSAMTEVLKLDPNKSSVLVEAKQLNHLEKFSAEAEVAYSKRDYSKVLDCMDRCCEVSTLCPAFELRRAECLTYLNKFKEAWQIADDILLMDQQNVDAVYVRGLCHYYQDDLGAALKEFQQLFRVTPDHTRALDIYKRAKILDKTKQYGNTAFILGEYTRAFDLYTEALTVDPQNLVINSKLHFNRALTYAKLNNFEKCIRECTEALKLNKTYLKALLKRALCHTELGNFEEAVCDYEEAYKLDASREHERLLHEADLALEKRTKKNYYKILGIDKNAIADVVKQAFRKKALAHHPDKHVNASVSEQKRQERKFKLVDEAYKILSDPQERIAYDKRNRFSDEF